MKRETICSQVLHCLSCPLSVMRTGKDCRMLTAEELAAMQLVFEKERAHYTLDEEVEYLKALDLYTRELCKEEAHEQHEKNAPQSSGEKKQEGHPLPEGADDDQGRKKRPQEAAP